MERQVKAHDELGRSLAADKIKIREWEDQIKALEKQVDGLREKVDENERAFADMPYPDIAGTKTAFRQQRQDYQAAADKETAPLREKIAQADELNTAFRTNKRHFEIQDEVKAAEKKVEALTAVIAQCDKEKEDKLAAAKLPLAGLSFDESGILLNKLPLGQGSQAEQLKSVLAIGFALKPKIRVALVRDASILDDESLKQVEALCAEQDAQVWLESVLKSGQTPDPTAIVIEDGAVKE